MATNSTYVEIQNNVLSLISKSDSTTRNRIKNWINLGYQNFVLREEWPFRQKTGTLTLVSGTQEYDLSTNFSDLDENNINGVSIQGSNSAKLLYIPYSQLRITEPDFDSEGTSVPNSYYLRAGQIGFWPSPSTGDSVFIDYSMTPTELSADADVPIVPLAYREALLQYALSMEHDFNTDPDLAVKAMNTYENILAQARVSLLSQPGDNDSFRILGPMDFVNPTDIGN